MNRKTTLTAAGILMIVLAVAIGGIGLMAKPNILVPPIITGVGFLVVAWVFLAFRKNSSN
ncbi:MAG: hypothetical protein ACRD6X_02365 [Pyrinomonadaceae bacterium]